MLLLEETVYEYNLFFKSPLNDLFEKLMMTSQKTCLECNKATTCCKKDAYFVGLFHKHGVASSDMSPT